MTLDQITRLLDARLVGNTQADARQIKMACGSDLMSDVLAFIKADALLLTGLTHVQVVRTAEMADIAAVCFVRGKHPGDDVIRLADSAGIPLLTTELTMYEACGRLYQEGLPGCHEKR